MIASTEAMSRHEADREDLFAEFRSAQMKWEVRCPDWPEPIVLGIRKNQRLSIYLGQDPCFHFDEADRLQRAFVSGALYRTQGRTLAKLVRQRDPATTTLLRTDLSDSQRDQFLADATTSIRTLSAALTQGEFDILRAEGTKANWAEMTCRIGKIDQQGVQLAPAYPGRRQ